MSNKKDLNTWLCLFHQIAHQRDEEQHDEDKEQYFRNAGSACCNSSKAENGCDDCDDEEYEGVA
jgi:hypothetical protein